MKLGVMVSDLGASQLSYNLIRRVNARLAGKGGLDVIAFYEAPVNPCLPMNFSRMPAYEAWGYNGAVVATTFSTARKLQGFPSPKVRAFYLWDLEWVRGRNRLSHAEWAAVYRDPSLSLLVRNRDHADLVEQCWNRPVAGIVDDFDLEAILGLI